MVGKKSGLNEDKQGELASIDEYIRCHHERWAGNGYKAKQI